MPKFHAILQYVGKFPITCIIFLTCRLCSLACSAPEALLSFCLDSSSSASCRLLFSLRSSSSSSRRLSRCCRIGTFTTESRHNCQNSFLVVADVASRSNMSLRPFSFKHVTSECFHASGFPRKLAGPYVNPGILLKSTSSYCLTIMYKNTYKVK